MRRLTIVIDVEQPEANWIWDCHLNGKTVNGIKVAAIHEGDTTEEPEDKDY